MRTKPSENEEEYFARQEVERRRNRQQESHRTVVKDEATRTDGSRKREVNGYADYQGHVTLSGVLTNWATEEEIKKIAEGVPGVSKVTSDFIVSAALESVS